MELNQIRYFVAMSKCLNFTRAAELCSVSQPALTRAIKKLEDELGGPLFRREGRRTHLTELGRMVRPRFEQALSLTDLAKDDALDFSKMVNAKLDLGCMCTIAPSSIISLIEFFSHHTPQLSLMLHEASGSRLTELLLDGEIDVAILALPELPDELHAYPLFEEPYVITFPKGHHFEEMDAVPVEHLAGERYLKRVNCEYLDLFEAEGFAYHFGTDHRFKSEHETWIQAMVIAGLCCAIMPESLSLNPELPSKPLVEPELRRTISVVTRRGRMHTPTVDLFMKLCARMDWGADVPAERQAANPCTNY
ncbi:MAG: LysR family transcriptional regulator [Pseudomonadota bacterium]